MEVLIALPVLIPAAWLFLIKPARRSSDILKFIAKQYAHKGLHDSLIPENSLEAFKRAAAGGYGVELDVQLTRDGEAVVFHDKSLLRMCGVDKNLVDLPYSELKELSLSGTDHHIPTLAAALDTMGDMPVICEIKHTAGLLNTDICANVYDIIKDRNNICVESFSPFLVRWFRKNHPDIFRGQLSENFFKRNNEMSFFQKFIMSFLVINVISRPHFVAWRVEDSKSIALRLCRTVFKAPCISWTTDGIKEPDKLFDTCIFELKKHAEDQ